MTRVNLWVCEQCLMEIESREGMQATHRHDIDEYDTEFSKCDWCEQNGNDALYELI